MYSKLLINFALIIMLAVIQIAFISGLPGWFKYLNLLVVVIIFLLVLTNFRLALYWALALGMILDLYSFTIFGLNLLFLTIGLLAANWLLNNFFTNRSLYTFAALVIAANLIFKIGVYFAGILEFFILQREAFSFGGSAFWLGELKGLAVNVAAVAVLFYVMSLISKNLKPAFLIKKF